MNKRLILTTIPAVLALCLISACNKPSSTAPGSTGASPSTQSASSPMGSASTP